MVHLLDTSSAAFDDRPPFAVNGLAHLEQSVCHSAPHLEPASSQSASRDSASSCGWVRVIADPEHLEPLRAHIERLGQLAGRRVVATTASPQVDPWFELGLHLSGGATPPAQSPTSAFRARLQSTVAIVIGDGTTQVGANWRAAFEALSLAPEHNLLVVQLVADETADGITAKVSRPRTERTVFVKAFGPEERERWWTVAMATLRQRSALDQQSWETLEGWWTSLDKSPLGTPSGQAMLTSVAQSAWRMLELPRHPLTLGQTHELARAALMLAGVTEEGSEEVLKQLESVGVLHAEQQRVLCRHGAPGEATLQEQQATANVLLETREPWAQLRAGELVAHIGAPEPMTDSAVSDLCDTMHEAIARMSDSAARSDAWSRWCALAEHLEAQGRLHPEQSLAAWHTAANRAIELGDGEQAHDLACRALRRVDTAPRPSSLPNTAKHVPAVEVLMTHARSCHLRGDLSTAIISLSRAIGESSSTTQSRRGHALMALIRFEAGDPDVARSYAKKVLQPNTAGLTKDEVEQHLEARNVLGKMLLADQQWRQAEEHFAKDAYDATFAGLTTAKLRAEVNRAIAVLYLGNRDEARRMVTAVLEQGKRDGVPTAVAFALSNLATIAILEGQYESALSYATQAIDIRHRLGNRLGLIRSYANLVDLRVRLGLLEDATNSLRFWERACGRTQCSTQRAFFKKAEALIALEKEDTVTARLALEEALGAARCIGEQRLVAACYRLMAQAALLDGSLDVAKHAIERSEEGKLNPIAEVESALLRARHLQASGKAFSDVAGWALEKAENASDREHTMQAHVLLSQAARNDGDDALAQHHLERAQTVRDAMAAGLPMTLRARFLQRAECLTIEQLEHQAPAPAESKPRRIATRPSEESNEPAEREMIGHSQAMQWLHAQIHRVAMSDTALLIHGETGSGKELVAEAIHRSSARGGAPLVKLNCAALVEDLLLSELFGHEKGAFTGATTRRRGRFEVAEGGTLFLDEIGDISPRTQTALLRILQEGTYERVGGSTTLKADVRVVCATHRDLPEMVKQGRFREDLYYRLCGITVNVPPLRERKDDIPLLAEKMLSQTCEQNRLPRRVFSPSALETLRGYEWPGNVRELQNVARVAALFASSECIDCDDLRTHAPQLFSEASPLSATTDARSALSHFSASPLSRNSASTPSMRPSAWPGSEQHGEPSAMSAPGASDGTGSADLVYAQIRSGVALADMKKRLERACIERALIESRGNITQAAKLLGMKRPRLSQLVKQYELASVLEEMKS